MPRLRGGACYYAVFENAATYPTKLSADYLRTVTDNCGDFNMTSDRYYLAFDMNHSLDDPVSGNRVGGRVLQGLTH